MLGQVDLAAQSLFAGRYRVVRRIAAGGMGAVFEVVHTETQRRRALKVMLPELLANKHLRERFQMEARITANVESEYIVDVFDAGIDEATGMPFLVMELLNGEDLGKVVDRGGALPPALVVTYLRQVASALDKTHAAGIVHRDLKPENLFLTHREDGTPRVKILDFGISKVVTEAQTGGGMNATRGLGTPLYMAPEQALAQPLSGATDRYALGLIAYSLLVGVPYWHEEASTFDNAITFVVHTSRGITDSASARAGRTGHALSPAFDAWFRRATHLDPAQRFATATELVRELGVAVGAPSPLLGSGALGPDSTGSVPSSTLIMADTMVARTAPGTELGQRTTGSNAAASSKAWLWLGLAGAGLVGISLVGAFALRSHGSASPAASDARSASSVPATSEPPAIAAPSAPPDVVTPIVSAPVASSSASERDTPAAATAPSKANLKSPANVAKIPAKTPAPPTHQSAAPRYTRD